MNDAEQTTFPNDEIEPQPERSPPAPERTQSQVRATRKAKPVERREVLAPFIEEIKHVLIDPMNPAKSLAEQLQITIRKARTGKTAEQLDRVVLVVEALCRVPLSSGILMILKQVRTERAEKRKRIAEWDASSASAALRAMAETLRRVPPSVEDADCAIREVMTALFVGTPTAQASATEASLVQALLDFDACVRERSLAFKWSRPDEVICSQSFEQGLRLALRLLRDAGSFDAIVKTGQFLGFPLSAELADMVSKMPSVAVPRSAQSSNAKLASEPAGKALYADRRDQQPSLLDGVIRKLQKDLAACRSERDHLEARRNSLDEVLHETQQQLERALRHVDALEQTIASNEESIAKLYVDRDTAQERVRTLEHKFDEVRKEVVSARAANAHAKQSEFERGNAAAHVMIRDYCLPKLRHLREALPARGAEAEEFVKAVVGSLIHYLE